MPAIADPTAIEVPATFELEEPPTNGDGRVPEATTAEEAEALERAEGLGETELAEREELRRPLQPIRRPLPIRPILRLRHGARGRYRGLTAGWEAELRVDVHGHRPMRRLSGDFFSRSGRTTKYFGSWRVDALTVTQSSTQVVCEGTATFTWSAANRRVRVTVPRTPILSTPGTATLQFLTPSGAVAATYSCPHESFLFRAIQLEQDSVAGTVPFVSYDTGSLPAPDPDRVLTVPKAYEEAGIELQLAGTPNVIPISAAGTGASPSWSDAEMHNAMVNHFSLFANVPQWRLWLLVATRHDGGYRGIMFDYSGAHQRQGAAVFYDAIGGSSAETQRAALRTYVHEIGHALNLMHSWQKDLATPPAPLGPNGGLGDLSWMNYVQNYNPGGGAPSGAAAYWASFPFQFVDSEVVHLRHGFRNHVIPGGDGFGQNAAEVDPQRFVAPVDDGSGLQLELRCKDVFAYGEPVVVEVKLATTDLRGVETHAHLHPMDELTTIVVRQPSGRCVQFRPLLRHCIDHDARVRLDREQPAIYDSAYIGYGADGFLFEQPGSYELRAEHVAADGSRIVSNVARLRVRQPVTTGDQHAGELLLGQEQGQLLAMLGSDSEALAAGNAAFDELLDRYPKHRLATYAKLARGVNCLRDFKDLTAHKEVEVREAQAAKSAELLGSVETASKGADGVDNITLNMVMRKHAAAEQRKGNTKRADAILDAMPDVFQAKGVRAEVVETIRVQAEVAKAELAAER